MKKIRNKMESSRMFSFGKDIGSKKIIMSNQMI